jgi:uncharacterized membrane protein (UPF0136 family)
MKPIYWIPLLAVIGGLFGYFLLRTTGWSSTSIGVIVGVIIGTIIYAMKTRQSKES